MLVTRGSVDNSKGIAPDFLVNFGVQREHAQGIDGVHALVATTKDGQRSALIMVGFEQNGKILG